MDVIYHDRDDLHPTHILQGRPYEPFEVPARATTILRAMREAGFGRLHAPTDHGIDPLLAVHASDYLDFLQNAFARNTALVGKPTTLYPEILPTRHVVREPDRRLGVAGYYATDGDSPILETTWEAAYWSTQCALTAADILLQTQGVAYALCRPPGHHAGRDMYGGFCYLNNIAIAARYLQQTAQTDCPLAILDIDYHHGNGTQTLFYTDPTVLFCSLHGHPDTAYPYYYGMDDERGEGAGLGYNRNWPLPRHTAGPAYLAALDEALGAIQEYAPRFLLVSAGYDTSAGDPYGDFLLTPADLHAVGRRIAALKQPTLIVQEGGYLLATLGEQALAFLSAFVSSQE
jgi:acetoin utilization deacetylase AcuC-like enzyme